jgi:hypothetical protein
MGPGHDAELLGPGPHEFVNQVGLQYGLTIGIQVKEWLCVRRADGE